MAVLQNSTSFSGLVFPRFELASTTTCSVCLCLWVLKAGGQSDRAKGREDFPTVLPHQGRHLPTLSKEILAWLDEILLGTRSCASISCIRRRNHRLEI